MKIIINGEAVEVGGGGSGGEALDIYSTEETRIGTWIDGKPLYRRVINAITPATTNANHTIADNLNIDRFVSFQGFIYQSNGYVEPIVYSTTNSRCNVSYNGSQLVMFMTASPNTNCPYNITLKYTKTSDQSETT